MKKILHVINGLGSGGAENMLYKTLKYSNKSEYEHVVISLLDAGIYEKKIEDLGIEVYKLNLDKKNLVSSLIKSWKIAKNFDVINTWLYHADIFGFVLSKILLKKKLIWNIRHSNLDQNANKPSTLRIIKLNSKLSKYVNSITYNSYRALEVHTNNGYKNKESIVIPNGFELNKFKYNENKREMVRDKLNINFYDKVIITVGRWDIQKDYCTLIKALNEVKRNNTNFKLIMIGSKLNNENQNLVNLIKRYDLANEVLLLGRKSNIATFMSAADVYVSSSLGESFSNSIGEAMACELPCLVTDVGDSKLIVGDTGKVVPAKDYTELAKELNNFINTPIMGRNKEARKRVMAKYDIKDITYQFYKNISNVFSN